MCECRSLEALGCHSAELAVIVGVDHVGVDYCGRVDLLNWLLGYVDPVVDDEERVGSAQDFVVEGDAVQVLFQQGFEHLVVLV